MSEKNGGAANGQGSEKAASGRDSGGRFATGNKGGPGNPFARQMAANRKAIADAVSAEDLAAIMAAMAKKAREGDVAAAKLVLSYGGGKTAQAPDPDTLDAHELQVRRTNTASMEDVKALFERCPAELLCAIAAVVAPQVQAHLEQTFAQGVRRQEESEKKERKLAPEAPGPYPGRKSDWAPPWMKRGISEEVELLFEACPPWMPDVMGTDRLPHAYADMLRDVRRSLLDALPGMDANSRQPAMSADTKRLKRAAVARTT